jgi:hypothetical protein
VPGVEMKLSARLPVGESSNLMLVEVDIVGDCVCWWRVGCAYSV